MSFRKWQRTKIVLKLILKLAMNPGSRKTLPSSNLPSFHPEPYDLQNDNDGFSFDTDSGISYSLYFTEGKYYVPGASYADSVLMFGIKPIGDSILGPPDLRIKSTVVYALLDIFESEPETVIVYVCDQSGKQEKVRSRLFNKWYLDYCKGFVRLQHEDDEQRTFAYAIFREDHPARKEIESTVQDFLDRKT
jgi:hypothetical protein